MSMPQAMINIIALTERAMRLAKSVTFIKTMIREIIVAISGMNLFKLVTL